MQLLALAVPGHTVLLDAARSPELAPWLAIGAILGAHDGKAMDHAVAATWQVTPSRWACAQVTQTLLAGGAAVDTTLPALAAQHGLPPPPERPDLSADTFAACSQTLAAVLASQIRALRHRHLVAASRIEAAAVSPIAAMERHGMPLNAARWRACVRDEAAQAQQLCQALGAALGCSIGIDDDENILRHALSAAGHPLRGFGQSAIATLPPTLRALVAPLMQLRRQARQLGDAWLRHLSADGRVHAHFVQLGARTGRMACTRPNLQAITAAPARRACFAPKPGRRLVMGDYAACELRILAEMSGDPAFVAAFAAGVDVHARVATELFGTTITRELHPERRQMAKVVSFGLIYGMGPQALGLALNISPRAAAQLTEQYFARYPRVAAFLRDAAAAAVSAGEARSLSGRVLDLHRVPGDSAATSRLARNMPIQGSSADMIKIALALTHARLGPTPTTQLVHCVHDEIVLECPEGDALAAQDLLHSAMMDAGAQLLRQVPIAVAVRHQASWQAH